ncbi:MAG TPA: DUF2933 domain-containing protein [Burkholderiales bacterium]|nr:DUF2933 domain-containing protein [Burkholderiales bacterium]
MEQEHRHGHVALRAKWVLLGFLLVAGYFVIAEHRAHLSGVLQYLPLLLVLACPLMHVFMHGRHGHHHGRGRTDDREQS